MPVVSLNACSESGKKGCVAEIFSVSHLIRMDQVLS
jgi:hypothetical protein